MDHLQSRVGWKTALAFALSIVIYIITPQLGSVWKLDGTLWN
jgi:hypothetical protein